MRTSGRSNPELYKKDRKEWKDDYTHLREQTLDYALQKIEKLFPALVCKAIALVGEEQASYWQAKDSVFVDLCSNGELGWTLKRHVPEDRAHENGTIS